MLAGVAGLEPATPGFGVRAFRFCAVCARDYSSAFTSLFAKFSPFSVCHFPAASGRVRQALGQILGHAKVATLRRGMAFPLYTLALILSFASDLLGCLAARIAGDDWPR
jgi:hypothetical protein